jgi:hypothetical protein
VQESLRSDNQRPINNVASIGKGHQGMSRMRKILTAVIAIGIGVTAVGAGTFASFSASTTNGGSTFATGTLVLSDQVNAATACLSTGGASTDTNANGACDQLFALTVKKPGDAATVNVTLKNEGSLDGSALKGFASAACAASNAAGQSFNGTGDPCGAVDVYVQEFSDSARTTPSTCHYGGGTASTCAYSAAKTLSSFGTAYPNAGTSISLGAAAAGTSRYFTIGLQMDSSSGNSMQGRQASFGLTWQLVQ